MAKDKRYKAVKLLIESGDIQGFSGIFDHIPRTIVAEDLQMSYRTMVGKAAHPAWLKASEIMKLADLIDVLPDVLFRTIAHEIKRSKK